MGERWSSQESAEDAQWWKRQELDHQHNGWGLALLEPESTKPSSGWCHLWPREHETKYFVSIHALDILGTFSLVQKALCWRFHKPFEQKSDCRTSYVVTESQTRGSAANLWNWGNKTFRYCYRERLTSGTKTWHISMACLASSLTSSLSTPDAQGSSSKYSTCHIRSVCENWKMLQGMN